MMYWNNREQSRHTFMGEWTRSGDKYVEDEDGYFVYCGRRDDMLKVSGMYVSPFEVEGALPTHPDVLEAAVVAWPDGDGLIKPKAFVVLKDQTKVAELPLVTRCRGRCRTTSNPSSRPTNTPAGSSFAPICRRPRPARSSASNCAARARRAKLAASVSSGRVSSHETPIACRLRGRSACRGRRAAVAQQKTIKIGFISTFSGPVAAIGNDMRNSFELALDHLGRKLGGLPVEVIYEDDQIKPEVGVQKTQKLIESDKVDFMVGYIWSNVALASLKPLVDSKTITVHHQRRRVADRRRAVLALRVLDLLEQRPDAAGGRPLHEPEGREDRVPDRPELRRRQGHAGRRCRRPSRARSSAAS